MNPKLKVLAAGQGGVYTRAQAAACGYTTGQIGERIQDGRWVRIRHGQYAEAVEQAHLAPWDQQVFEHRRRVYAVMNALRRGSVAVSHQSALVLHGVPLWGTGFAEVQVSRLDRDHGGRVAGVRHHRGRLYDADMTAVDGLPVTTVMRAWFELACTSSFETAVVSADAVLRDHPVEEDDVRRLLDVTEYWPGSATARSALRFANPLSESVGESRLRVLMHTHGLPAPLLQHVFHDAYGFVARVDFYFPAERTVVEFDGLLKYADGDRDTLIREKTREDGLRALGLQVVRVTWTDLDHPTQPIARIHQAFRRA
ncbi:type IV toxin-antitoxin system AbiEi family antitoxin domain-containing protein [Kribbella solani]|uniref:type IV toxin-antitoxin system AbiEi family antitoxin domain-containing protein n=1 Tax=Kribbella solani TaxID=236067 RepID=UPI0029A3799C|nr:type IV toxin-antitoxin system AbiEi family antitoxin domain-containing protein [Kribbella solani]MDX3003773.1 type IV toxin-antitoxin system AbiEi family antitoxin domain-containing protein [Kribbella solani]